MGREIKEEYASTGGKTTKDLKRELDLGLSGEKDLHEILVEQYESKVRDALLKAKENMERGEEILTETGFVELSEDDEGVDITLPPEEDEARLSIVEKRLKLETGSLSASSTRGKLSPSKLRNKY